MRRNEWNHPVCPYSTFFAFCILSHLFLAAGTSTVSESIGTTTNGHSSTGAIERTLHASSTPTIKRRTTQRHRIQSSINNWMHVGKNPQDRDNWWMKGGWGQTMRRRPNQNVPNLRLNRRYNWEFSFFFVEQNCDYYYLKIKLNLLSDKKKKNWKREKGKIVMRRSRERWCDINRWWNEQNWIIK